jgi:hypothetical protein
LLCCIIYLGIFVLEFEGGMKLVKKTTAFLCILAMMYASAGISLQRHSCSMSGRTTHQAFPEVFGATSSCCPAPQKSESTGTASVDKAACCKNIFYYYKLPVFNEQRVSDPGLLKIISCLPAIILPSVLPVNYAFSASDADYRPPPLKAYGKILLSCIHQLKFHLSL